MRSYSQADRARFLQFVTGTSKVPLQGFVALEGMNGIQKFQIHRDDRSTERLPSAHTWLEYYCSHYALYYYSLSSPVSFFISLCPSLSPIYLSGLSLPLSSPSPLLFPISFNHLDLPPYKTYDKLNQMLLTAIRECPEGFGFA